MLHRALAFWRIAKQVQLQHFAFAGLMAGGHMALEALRAPNEWLLSYDIGVVLVLTRWMGRAASIIYLLAMGISHRFLAGGDAALNPAILSGEALYAMAMGALVVLCMPPKARDRWDGFTENVPSGGAHANHDPRGADSNDDYQLSVRLSPWPMMIHCDDGRIVHVNQAWCQAMGLPHNHLPTIESWLALVLPEQREGLLKQIQRSIADATGADLGEFGCVNDAGETRYWRYWSSPLHTDATGRRLHVTMGQDVTALRRARETLATRVAAIEAAADMIVITNRHGVIEYVNPAFTAITGFPAKEVVGATPAVFRSGQHPPEFYDDMWATLRRGDVWQGTFINRRRDGQFFREESTITPVRDTSGEIVRYVAIKRDLSRREQLENAARERDELQRTVSAMQKVLGVVGHELRTPLAAVRAMSELVLEESIRQTAEGQKFLEQINREAVRMSTMVNDLLETARVNSGLAVWQWGEVDIAAAVRDAVETLRPLLAGRPVELSADVAPDVAMMRGDKHAIHRLLMNLLGNASKYTASGRIAVRVYGMEDDGNAYIEIEVRDSGSGIDAKMLPQLGKPFALNSGVVGDDFVQGAGLGLALCRGIAAAHGGQIHITSEQGCGTSVIVRLRRDLAEAAHGSAACPLTANDEANLIAI